MIFERSPVVMIHPDKRFATTTGLVL